MNASRTPRPPKKPHLNGESRPRPDAVADAGAAFATGVFASLSCSVTIGSMAAIGCVAGPPTSDIGPGTGVAPAAAPVPFEPAPTPRRFHTRSPVAGQCLPRRAPPGVVLQS